MAHSISTGTLDGFAVRTLASENQRVEASFAPSTGMVGCSLRHRGDELLGLRGGLAKYAESGSTMGIPLLYPWANRLAGFGYSAGGEAVELDRDSPLLHLDPNGLPIHGVLAASPYWEVADEQADEGAARLTARLDYAVHAELLEAFPFPHRIEFAAELRADTLAIRTTVTATGDRPVPVSFGYHPYFQLPNVPRPEWRVEIPVHRRLALDDRMIPTGEIEGVDPISGELGDRTFDDGYSQVDQGARFVLEGGGRRIGVEFGEGYPFAQVYAPPDQDVVCFEPMTAPTNALASGDGLPVVQPSESFTAEFSVQVAATA